MRQRWCFFASSGNYGFIICLVYFSKVPAFCHWIPFKSALNPFDKTGSPAGCLGSSCIFCTPDLELAIALRSLDFL